MLAEFRDGLYAGDGTQAPSVFVVGVGQLTAPLSVYKTNLRNRLADGLFWGAMQRTVRFWSQEVYGEVRASWGVANVSRDVRSGYTTEYSQHPIVLSRAGGDANRPALDFLERTNTPLANAAWRWATGFGNTMVSAEQTAMYVAEQSYSMRDFVRTYDYGLRNGRMGFARAQRNLQGDRHVPVPLFRVGRRGIRRRQDSERGRFR